MLNPETSSDSLSVKSKGVRLVSARTVMIQAAKMGISSSFLEVPTSFIFAVFRPFTIRMAAKMNTAIEIS